VQAAGLWGFGDLLLNMPKDLSSCVVLLCEFAAASYLGNLMEGSKGAVLMGCWVVVATAGRWWGRAGRGDAAPSRRRFFQPEDLQNKGTGIQQLSVVGSVRGNHCKHSHSVNVPTPLL
jgi:hypothetical protein